MADIVSVGIDIGTSTTQVVFSRLTMENAAGYFAVPRVSIVDKQVIYKGQVHTTPLKSPVLIDGAGVREIVAREYGRAGFRPADVETGAVIITGESAPGPGVHHRRQGLRRLAVQSGGGLRGGEPGHRRGDHQHRGF